MKEKYLLTILSWDRKGLVSIVTSILNRKGIEMESLSVAKTAIDNQVLIHIQLTAEAKELRLISYKIKNIVEVIKVARCLLKEAWYTKVAWYVLSKAAYTSEVFSKIQRHDARLIGYQQECVIIQKTGSDEDIIALYHELAGDHLKRFRQSAAMSLSAVIQDDEAVISMAA